MGYAIALSLEGGSKATTAMRGGDFGEGILQTRDRPRPLRLAASAASHLPRTRGRKRRCRTGHLRTSILMGPWARPWMNWST